MLDKIKSPVLRSDDQVRFPVPIKVANRRAAGMAGHISFCEITDLFKYDLPVSGILAISPPSRILGIRQDVESPVSVPVDHRKFYPAGASCCDGVESHRLKIFIKKEAGFLSSPALAGEEPLLVEYDEIELSVPIKIRCEWGCSPLSLQVFGKVLPPVEGGWCLL